MMRHAQFLFVSLMIMAPTTGWCGPAEEANAVVDRWSAAYSGNDPETIASNYCPDAILLGTVSPVISVGTQAIIKYFTPSNGSGNKNTIDERHTIPIDDKAALVTGLYTFTRIVNGNPTPGPSRFTMLVIQCGDKWCIKHHHSSPHVLPKS
jgi:uncharacterized protein (TIGR02246 family)